MSRITVCCRIRPSLLSRDSAVKVSNGTNTISLPSMEYSSKLDHVFNENTSQEQLFQQVVPPLVRDLFDGLIATWKIRNLEQRRDCILEIIFGNVIRHNIFRRSIYYESFSEWKRWYWLWVNRSNPFSVAAFIILISL